MRSSMQYRNIPLALVRNPVHFDKLSFFPFKILYIYIFFRNGVSIIELLQLKYKIYNAKSTEFKMFMRSNVIDEYCPFINRLY